MTAVSETRIREVIDNLGGRAQAKQIADALGTSAASVVSVMESSFTFRLFSGGWWRLRSVAMQAIRPELAAQPRQPVVSRVPLPPEGSPQEHNGKVKLDIVVRLDGKELSLPQFMDLTNRMIELRDYIKRWNE